MCVCVCVCMYARIKYPQKMCWEWFYLRIYTKILTYLEDSSMNDDEYMYYWLRKFRYNWKKKTTRHSSYKSKMKFIDFFEYIDIVIFGQTVSFYPNCFSVARPVWHLKPRSKPIQLHVRLSLGPLGQQEYHVGYGNF